MNTKIKVAAMADLHFQENSLGLLKTAFEDISKKADILLICGDLTEDGLVQEAKVLSEELASCKIPVLAVLGNHDYTHNLQEEIKNVLSPQIHFLENQPYVFKGIGFAGTKGFAGGFDSHLVTPYGEKILKDFVFESISEVMKLEKSLTKLDTKQKVVILHYVPIRQMLEGESLEVYSLLGTSRLSEPINSFNVSAVFHGHSHHGQTTGKTIKGIPVYNASFPLLSKLNPHQPYVIVEI